MTCFVFKLSSCLQELSETAISHVFFSHSRGLFYVSKSRKLKKQLPIPDDEGSSLNKTSRTDISSADFDYRSTDVQTEHDKLNKTARTDLTSRDFNHLRTDEQADQDELIQKLCANGKLEKALEVLSHIHQPLSNYTYTCLLQSCNKRKSLSGVKHVQFHIGRLKAPLANRVSDYLVMSLANCGAVEEAFQMSLTIPFLSLVSWNAIMFGYVELGLGRKVLEIYQSMTRRGLEPSSYTFVCLFKACGSVQDFEQGKILHEDARRRGLASNVFVGNTLLSMYGKCGAIEEAENVFIALSDRDLVSWNAMLSAYVDHNLGEKALQLYRQMQWEGVISDHLTIVFTLEASRILTEEERLSTSDCLEIWKALRAAAHKKGLASNMFVGTTLLSVCAKLGAVVEAEGIFMTMSHHDIASWNAIIQVYVKQKQGDMALQLFRQMQIENMSPDQLTIIISLQACSILAENEGPRMEDVPIRSFILEIGFALHSDACKRGYAMDILVSTAIMSMYGKCGTSAEAEYVFGTLPHHDLVSFTAMLLVYIEHGEIETALQFYKHMRNVFDCLDVVTFICILQACNATGSVQLCRELHFDIVAAGYDCIESISATLIRAYGSCANMEDGQAVFEDLPIPDIVTWTAMITGYAESGNSNPAINGFEQLHLARVQPCGVTFTSVMSACNHAGNTTKGVECLISMFRDYGVKADAKQYSVVLDLLGRAGDFLRLEQMLVKMPMATDHTMWSSLLASCRIHGNLDLAKRVFDQLLKFFPQDVSTYIVMESIWSSGILESGTDLEILRKIR